MSGDPVISMSTRFTSCRGGLSLRLLILLLLLLFLTRRGAALSVASASHADIEGSTRSKHV